jgi:hypothetical protein
MRTKKEEKQTTASIPKNTVSYVIMSPSGEKASRHRIRESAAWVNATRQRGCEMADVEAQTAEMEKMKREGFRCVRREGPAYSVRGNTEILHMRMTKKDKSDLEKLKKHYSDPDHTADASSVIRVLIAEKLESIAAAPEVAKVFRK